MRSRRSRSTEGQDARRRKPFKADPWIVFLGRRLYLLRIELRVVRT